MTTIFALLAVCLVVVNAASVPSYDVQVDEIIKEAAKIGVETAIALEHQFEEIVLDPLHQVDEAVQNIESLKDQDEECVIAEEEHVNELVGAMHDEMALCGVIAAKESAAIAIEVSTATQQLVFDGYDVLKTYQRCKNYKNPVLKNSCYARLSVKATLYTINARRSMKTIRQSKERIPVVFTESNQCTHVASDNAVQELEIVHSNIDACIARKRA